MKNQLLEKDTSSVLKALPSTRDIIYNLFVNLNRGIPPLKTQHLYKKFRLNQIESLLSIGIVTDVSTIYVGGLVSVPTASPYSLRNLNAYILNRINEHCIAQYPYEDQNELLQFFLPFDWIETQLYPEYSLKIISKTLFPYAKHLSKEIQNMELSEKIETLEDIITFIPDKTPIDAWDEPKRTTYKKIHNIRKDIKQTRKYNDTKMADIKRETAKRLYLDLKIKLRRATPQTKQELKSYIRSLRPSIKHLKTHYLNKGDTQAMVDMLVTPKSYPYLPNVWITKKQQKALLSIIDNSTQFSEYIQKGFK